MSLLWTTKLAFSHSNEDEATSLLILFCNSIYACPCCWLGVLTKRCVTCCDFICSVLLFQGHVTSPNLTLIGPHPSQKIPGPRLKRVDRYTQHQLKAKQDYLVLKARKLKDIVHIIIIIIMLEIKTGNFLNNILT